MDSESKDLLEKTFELEKENNKLLHKVRSFQNMQTLWSTLKIIVIIGVGLGAAYYFQPVFEKVMNIFNQVSGMKQSADNASLEKLLKNVRP